jgi:hypothetical protein
MIDPINEEDGCACEGCGDRADGAVRIVGRPYDVALCAACEHDLTTICAGMCERRIWQSEGVRLFGASLHCPTCAKPWVTVSLERDNGSK